MKFSAADSKMLMNVYLKHCEDSRQYTESKTHRDTDKCFPGQSGVETFEHLQRFQYADSYWHL